MKFKLFNKQKWMDNDDPDCPYFEDGSRKDGWPTLKEFLFDETILTDEDSHSATSYAIRRGELTMRWTLFIVAVYFAFVLASSFFGCTRPVVPQQVGNIRFHEWRIGDPGTGQFGMYWFSFFAEGLYMDNNGFCPPGTYIYFDLTNDIDKSLVDQNYYPPTGTYSNATSKYGQILKVSDFYSQDSGVDYYPDDGIVTMTGNIKSTTFDISFTDNKGQKRHYVISVPLEGKQTIVK